MMTTTPTIDLAKHPVLALLREDEGLRLKAYRCTAGALTIGYGHNIDSNGMPADIASVSDAVNRGITKAQADELLLRDAAIALANARRLVPGIDGMSPNRQAALISMAFQLGGKTMASFYGTLRAVNTGQWREAARGMRLSRWAKQTPNRVARLARMIEFG
jgi:lysozyme